MNNKQIFETLVIKSVKGFKFGSSKVQCEASGLALYSKEYGFLSFGDNVADFNIELPYIPRGGRKVLKSLLETGLTSYDNIRFIKNI